LAALYEAKEAARRTSDWVKRDVFLDKRLPLPSISFDETE
jgi:hypothetical protein